MGNETIYIKAEQNIEVTTKEVYLKDIAGVFSKDKHMAARINTIKIHTFRDAKAKREVIGMLKIIAMIQEIFPAVTVESLGCNDIVIEQIKQSKEKKSMEVAKICLVSLVSFFGTAFTIMAFHNDISINKLFMSIYEIIMGTPSDGYTTLEIAYSIGLGLGIIVFFNHIGGKRITKDPTPIEVAMRLYENDVNTTLIETASREGKEIDV